MTPMPLSLAAALLLAAGPATPPQPLSPYLQREGKAGHVHPAQPQTGTTPAAQPRPASPCLQREGHAGHGGQHGNPADLERYAAGLDDPARDGWQRPDEVVKALGLAAGQVACDVGAGTGYFSVRLAAAVGPSGRVFAVDVEPAMLAKLLQRLSQGGIGNVTPVLALPADPLLPPDGCDLVLVVNTYHHFPDGPAYLRRLATSLRPGGRLVNVDFHKRETGMGPPVAHRVAREAFLADAAAAGLGVVSEPAFLPHQYFVVLAQLPAR